jgi:ribosomal protein S18 acetylase RimI-like enzyme
MLIHLIEFATPEYDEAVALRDEVLSRPLGLHFTAEQLALEYDQLHLAAFNQQGTMVGYINLTPLEDGVIQMRQVAVSPALQRSGIGSEMVAESEKIALARGYYKMILHARDIAVPFYLKLGYQVKGEPFEEVTIQHFQMEKDL